MFVWSDGVLAMIENITNFLGKMGPSGRVRASIAFSYLEEHVEKCCRDITFILQKENELLTLLRSRSNRFHGEFALSQCTSFINALTVWK